MSNIESDLMIKNENLFRTLAFTPIALLLLIFAGDFLSSSLLVLFKIFYVLMMLYSTVSALAYGAFYTNDVYEGRAESLIKNNNLFKALIYTPLAALFYFFAVNSIMSSSHVVFNMLYILMTMYFTLSAIAYAAFYTNDRYDDNTHEASH